MVNIFIALSQHHLDVFENNFLGNSLRKNKNILLTSNRFTINYEIWDEVFSTNFDFHNQSNSKMARVLDIILKIRAYKSLIKKIEKYKDEKVIMLYYSSLEDILSNYLFFNYSSNIQGIIIEDGILNYYTHTLKNVSKLSTFLKRVLVIPFGLRYCQYKGHTTGIDYRRSLYQYVRMPKYATRPEKSRELVYGKRNVENISNDILIIGQEPYANLFGAKKFENNLKRLFYNIKRSENYSNSKIVYYKPHRNGPRIDYNLLRVFFKEKEVIVIDSKDTIDNIFFNEVRCKYLFTFDSSAVLNIYSVSNDVLRNNIEISVMPLLKNEITTLFSIMNFKIIDNDI